jgi:hypothetical protein
MRGERESKRERGANERRESKGGRKREERVRGERKERGGRNLGSLGLSLFEGTVDRPPVPYTAFLAEIPEFLSELVVMADNIHIFGYFNILMEKSTSYYV